nr:MAG TPA: hypothetical protein [Caudoviricetes sp.]
MRNNGLYGSGWKFLPMNSCTHNGQRIGSNSSS